jgi:truncated hemoglobin YjbI
VNKKILANIVSVSALNPSPIGDSFKGLSADDVQRVEANLLDFLVMVYGGPDNYRGKSMRDAHAGLKITTDQYNAFLSMVVVPALTDAGVTQEDIGQCFAPPLTDPAFVADIVEL